MINNDNPTEVEEWAESIEVPPEVKSWIEELSLNLLAYMRSHPEDLEERK